MALILALLACGRQAEFVLRQQEVELDEEEVREDYVYYQMALKTLDMWGQASTIALGTSASSFPEQNNRTGSEGRRDVGSMGADDVGALHILHWFAHRHGGPAEFNAVLSRMLTQCRLLGAHRQNTASLYPSEEKVGLLFFLSLYKDS